MQETTPGGFARPVSFPQEHNVKQLLATIAPRIVGLGASPVALAPLLDSLPVGIALLDMSHRILLLNRAMAALTGFTTAEVQGVPCHHVLRTGLCHHRCPLRIDGADLPAASETELLNRNRRRVPVRLTLVPLHDAEGLLAGWLHSAEDLSELRQLETTARGDTTPEFIGRGTAMTRVFETMRAAAETGASLLVTGETGTGKDALAEAVHRMSPRSREPFVKAAVGSLPEQIIASELFGHVQGAFPGATEARAGKLRMAHGGTLYLAELADLPLSVQGRLLTFLDAGIAYPEGSTDPYRPDVRIIAATNREPEALVADSTLREDLLRRLDGVRVHMPPVRQRGEDIEFLLSHFLSHFAARQRKTLHGFSGRSLRILLSHPFPGNVRELKNVVEYAATLCEGGVILPAHLPGYLQLPVHEATQLVMGTTHTPGTQHSPGTPSAAEAHTQAGSAAHPDATSASARASVEDLERRLMTEALERAFGNRSRAAQLLGWGRSTLWRKMKQYGMN